MSPDARRREGVARPELRIWRLLSFFSLTRARARVRLKNQSLPDAGCRRRAYRIIARPCCDRAMAALQEITVIATEEKLKRIATARAGKR